MLSSTYSPSIKSLYLGPGQLLVWVVLRCYSSFEVCFWGEYYFVLDHCLREAGILLHYIYHYLKLPERVKRFTTNDFNRPSNQN